MSFGSLAAGLRQVSYMDSVIQEVSVAGIRPCLIVIEK
jgi:hypothetical protein